jgi:hypothetical protein
LDTQTLYYRMDPRKIVQLKALLDGHEGLLVLRTHDPHKGIVQLLVSPDFSSDVLELISSLSHLIWMEPVPAPRAPTPTLPLPEPDDRSTPGG